MVPQQRLANTTAPGVAPEDRRRLDLVVYGATPNGVALCCDATLVSALTRNGLPAHAADSREGAAIAVARKRKPARYPELGRGKPQRLCVLAAEVGGRWGDEAQQLVRQLVRLRGRRAPTALRAAAQGWARRWWSILAVAVQRAVCSALPGTWSMPAIPANADSIPLAGVLDLADAALPSRLPLR